MPITESERLARRDHIGGSDMAAILHLDPRKSAEDIRLEKLGRLIEKPPTDAMNAGTWFESGVLAYAAERLGEINTHPGPKAVEGTPIVVNTDGLVLATGEPVEAKTTRLFGPTTAANKEEWGEEGTDQVPSGVIIQATVHMMAWDRPVCHVPVLIGGRGLLMYEIPRNVQIVDIIGTKAAEFWERNVLGDMPVEGSAASLEVVKLLKKEPNKIVAVNPAIVQAWLDAKEAEKETKEAMEQAQAAVLAALGDAEAGECGSLGAITYLSQHRKGYAVQETDYRVLRHKARGL